MSVPNLHFGAIHDVGKKSTTIVIGLKKGGKNEETMQENYSLSIASDDNDLVWE